MRLKIEYSLDKVWFTSDTHYGHSNICKGTSKWDPSRNGTRDFKTLEEMNDCIVNTINKYVKEDHILFHLGDWSFGGLEMAFELSERINCVKTYLNYGNHDHNIERDRFIEINMHKHFIRDEFTKVADVFNLTIKDKNKEVNIFTSHYAHLVWDRSHHGNIHLFGHSHATINDAVKGKCMDVGIDNAYLMYGEYRPFNLMNDILPYMKTRDIAFFDHHDTKTTR